MSDETQKRKIVEWNKTEGGKEAVWLSKTSLLRNSNRPYTDRLLRLIYKCELTAEDEWKQTFWFYCQRSSQAGRHIIYCHVMQVVTVIPAPSGFVQIKCKDWFIQWSGFFLFILYAGSSF